MNKVFKFNAKREKQRVYLNAGLSLLALAFTFTPIAENYGAFIKVLILIGAIGGGIVAFVMYIMLSRKLKRELVFRENTVSYNNGDKVIKLDFNDITSAKVVKKNVTAMQVKKSLSLTSKTFTIAVFLEDYDISEKEADNIVELAS